MPIGTKETIVLFAKYNKLANAAMDEVIKTLTAEEWDKPLGGYFSSVRGLCSHTYLCDFNWLKRFSNLRPFAVLQTPFFERKPYSFSDVLFPDLGEYLAKRPELDEHILAFVEEITDADLAAPLAYLDSSGTRYEKNFGGLVLRSLNHDTHHRGMISAYLELLGKPNDYSSLGQALD